MKKRRPQYQARPMIVSFSQFTIRQRISLIWFLLRGREIKFLPAGAPQLQVTK